MKKFQFIFMFAVFAMIMTACRTTRPPTVPAFEPVVLHNNDSVRVETNTVTVFVHDTIQIEIPAQTAERTTPDSTSHLENDFAVSDARINPDGTLFHNLETKPGKLDVPFEKPVEKSESVVERIKEIEKPVPTPVPVEVERKLNWWESTCIKFAPWAFGLLIIAIGYIFRKPMINLARRFIGSK